MNQPLTRGAADDTATIGLRSQLILIRAAGLPSVHDRLEWKPPLHTAPLRNGQLAPSIEPLGILGQSV
jgi:hypothetical protein